MRMVHAAVAWDAWRMPKPSVLITGPSAAHLLVWDFVMTRVIHNVSLVLRVAAVLSPVAVILGAAEVPEEQVAQYQAQAPKTIVELQEFRRTTSAVVTDASGKRGSATLVEINPNINAWFLLRLDWEGATQTRTYHLENADARGTHLWLAQSGARGLRLSSGAGEVSCILWPDSAAAPLEQARLSGLPYAPLCGGRLYLRNVVPGTSTRLEVVTNFLRDHVWGGDQIVNFVKREFFRDAFAEKGAETAASAAASSSRGPPLADVDNAEAGTAIVPEHLDIDLSGAGGGLTAGAWYPVSNASGIYVSAIRPEAVADSILSSFRGRVSALDGIEADAVDYMVAFDLAEFDLRFALGTDHPRVTWSGRELPAMRDERLAGPDGIGASAPLARIAMVNPALTARMAATFAGGFKREHGAFRYGALARQNHGSHYGFIEQGAVFSKLQPGLATLYVLDDGSVGMKTWSKDDDVLLPRLRYARQNGVPLIEHVAGDTPGNPGPLVSQWGPGNWSGSADVKLRTLRSGLCLQAAGARRFLIYGYFSTATPSAMARVFQAYGCQYAMHLDMNAPEHTYLAVYTRRDGRLVVQHLVEGMGEVDRKRGGQLAPRFLSFPDDRDFFYLVRHATGTETEQAAR